MEKELEKQKKIIRYQRDSNEFGRVTGLSDGVFAIAMTLLVLTLDIPDVPAEELGRALLGQFSQFVAIILSFVMVATIWWQNKRFISLLESFEPGLIWLNIALLGMVVLLPYPTNLVGNDPRSSVSVFFFIILFVVMNLIYIMLILRAYNTSSFLEPMSPEALRKEIRVSFSGLVFLVFPLVLSIWFPLAAFIIVWAALILSPISVNLFSNSS